MNEEQRAELLGKLIENPPSREELLTAAGATSDESSELLSLAETADTLWVASRVPQPLDEDPIAALLGVAPASAVAMDPSRFRTARKRANVTVSRLRALLAAKGWTVTGAEIGSWQTNRGTEVIPAMLEDISSILSVAVSDLTVARPDGAGSLFATLRAASWFQELTEQWQEATGVLRSVAEAQLLTRATATVHRGDQPDLEQIHDLLEHLVATRQDPREQ